MMENFFAEIRLIIGQHLPTYIEFWVGKISNFFTNVRLGLFSPYMSFEINIPHGKELESIFFVSHWMNLILPSGLGSSNRQLHIQI